MDVVHEEHAAPQGRQRLVERGAIESARHPFEPVEHASLVSLGLELTQEPGAGVRQGLVVEIHRVLRGQHDTHAERACLLEQREQRRLRRRVGDRRQVSEHFVHVEQRPQGPGARLAACPLEQRVEDERHDQHAFGIAQVRDRDHRDGRAPGRVVEHRAHVQRNAVEPHVESRRGQHAVEPQRQLLAFLGRVVGFQVEHADAVERGLLNLLHQPRQIRRGRRRRGCEDGRQERQLAVVRAHLRVAGQREQARRGARDARPGIFVALAVRRPQRTQQGQRRAGAAARRQHAHGRGVPQLRDACGRLVPVRQALPPRGGLLLGELVGRQALRGGIGRIDPGTEVRGHQRREREEQVGEIALGIDGQHRDAVDRGLLDEPDAQAGLAAAGHADADRVGDQILRVVEDQFVAPLRRGEVVLLSEVEQSEFLVVDRHVPHHMPRASSA